MIKRHNSIYDRLNTISRMNEQTNGDEFLQCNKRINTVCINFIRLRFYTFVSSTFSRNRCYYAAKFAEVLDLFCEILRALELRKRYQETLKMLLIAASTRFTVVCFIIQFSSRTDGLERDKRKGHFFALSR